MIDKYPHNEIIKRALKNKSDLVYRGGLNYLIPQWQEFVDNSGDEDSSLSEWLNDLECRKIIDDILQMPPDNEKNQILIEVKHIDKTFIERTFEITDCIWGKEVEEANNFDSIKNWYYYRINRAIYDSEDSYFTKRK